jgi:PAS domain-containing protein
LVAPEILGDIIAEISDLGIVIADSGQVLSVLANPSQDFFRRLDHWDGKDIRDVLTIESVSKFNARLDEFVTDGRQMRPVELNHSDDQGRWEFPIRYSFHRIGPDGAILLLGRDLRPVAEMQQQLIKAQMSLERDYEAQREFDTRFRVLMESTREALVFVAVKSGKITEANSIAAAYLDESREDLVGLPMASAFELRKRGDLIEALTAQAAADRAIPVKAVLRRTGALVAISPTLFRAAGERLLLCRQSPDAIVFANEAGTILSANESFLDLIDMAHDLNVKGRSFADYLQRGSVDLKVLTENASRTGRLRMYPTKIAGEFSSARGVEIAVTCLTAGTETVFAFVIREVSKLAGHCRANDGCG